MAPYYPVHILRSDGLTEVTTKAGVIELNQPTAAQLSDTPDANGNVDCYKRLEPDNPKAVDWNRKLGGMLMHLLGGKDHSGTNKPNAPADFSLHPIDRNYILKELPDGYVLWEHVKYNTKKLAEEKGREKGKHAAGVFERQDAYLYGHPQGRKKRYRSPADFFPHLLWLGTDPDDNRSNCSCKICSPEGDDEDEPVKTEAQAPVPVKKESKILPPQPAPKSTPAPAPLPKPISQPPQQAAPRAREKKADGEPNGSYLYRPGELVWFNNGLNWRLGVIAKRGLLNNNPRYQLQPLSNPLQHQPYQIKDEEILLRPWLAWSVPDTTIPALKNMEYDKVPWDRVINGDYDQSQVRDYVVDGSILAAKVIDASYSLFDRIENALVGPGEIQYNGMFLGAEKIWVGEPVRLRIPGNDIVVLIIHKLIERQTPNSTATTVTFIGDVYKFVEMPTPYRNRSEWPTPALPPRMVADLRFRNEVADNAKKGIWYEWRLLEPAARRGMSDIKGRWYETRTLLPILRGAEKFQEDITKGKTSDAGEWMNGRRDNNTILEQRRKNRRDTFGLAVPADFKVSRGLDGTPADDAFPNEQPAAQTGYEDGDMSQYMDLDQGSLGHDFYENSMQH
jgi:hypothetical protein